MNDSLTIGVDIGGSHLTSALINNVTKEIIRESIVRNHYDHTLEMESLLNIWATTIKMSMSRVNYATKFDGIGIAMPGPFEYADGISKIKHKLVCLYNKHLPTELNKALKLPSPLSIRFNNDATCFAVGEAFRGLGNDKNRVVVITLGTGFGAAFLENKIPIVDRFDVPPEGCLWHLPFRKSIADDYFSTGWFIAEYEKMTKKKITGVKEILSGEPIIAEQIFLKFANNLGDFLAFHLKMFGAEILIVGGNISKALDHFIDPLMIRLQEQNIQLEIAPSTLLEEAALIGSAQLFNEPYWARVSKVLPKI